MLGYKAMNTTDRQIANARAYIGLVFDALLAQEEGRPVPNLGVELPYGEAVVALAILIDYLETTCKALVAAQAKLEDLELPDGYLRGAALRVMIRHNQEAANRS